MPVKRLLLALLLSGIVSTVRAQGTFTAASCSYANVNAIINGPTHTAINGDTIVIPLCPGGVTWVSNLAIPATITLIGQGAGNTVIIDGTSKGDSNCQGVTSLMTATVSVRISSMTITGSGPPAFNCGESANHISLGGSSHQVRVDHITFNPFVTAIAFFSDVWGVVDHNTFNTPVTGNPPFTTMVHHESWLGVGSYGDNSWAQADTFGQAGAIYIENNSYNYQSNAFPTGCFDEEAGGRVVFRFNTGCPFVGMHGLESSARLRSGRAYEVYNNTFTAVVNTLGNMYTGVFLRGGTGFIFNNGFNDFSGSNYITLMQANNYRDTGGYNPWGPTPTDPQGCTGVSPFDTNAGTVYASFTAATSSTDNTVASGTPWTTNQWQTSLVGTGVTYSLVDTTAGWGSTIVSNTTNTIVTSAIQQAGNGPAHLATAGDAMQILSAYPCADQIGRGAGVYLSGSNPTPSAAVNQASDPLYEWLNAHNSVNQTGIISTNNYHLHQERDYYDYQTAGCSGTQSNGVCSGTLAARAANCTTGVGYWATDQGNWNQSGAGGQGQFYKCTSTNTWTLSYIPYNYPHPLITGGGSGQVATPTFNPVAGVYSSTQNITISTNTGGATLCYTTDGTTPTADGAGTCTHGTIYSTPVVVASSLTIKAIGSLSGQTDSAVGSATYTIGALPPVPAPATVVFPKLNMGNHDKLLPSGFWKGFYDGEKNNHHLFRHRDRVFFHSYAEKFLLFVSGRITTSRQNHRRSSGQYRANTGFPERLSRVSSSAERAQCALRREGHQAEAR